MIEIWRRREELGREESPDQGNPAGFSTCDIDPSTLWSLSTFNFCFTFFTPFNCVQRTIYKVGSNLYAIEL